MLHNFRKILTVCLLLISSYASADRFSYVYIQGDKQIPFYVKLEDYMLPRYSKNYCIIPQLAPGLIHLQILFQQNQYPAQSFNIQVPADGYRGFLLTKLETGFALYDIQQHFYLMPGDQGEDHLPVANVSTTAQLVTENKEPTTETSLTRTVNTSSPTTVTTTNNDAPQFMDMELNNERKPVLTNTPETEPKEEIIVSPSSNNTATNTPPTEIVTENNNYPPPTEPVYTPQEAPQQNVYTENVNVANEPSVEESQMHNTEEEMKQPVPELIENAPPIVNSDCSDALSDPKFDDIFVTSKGKNSDDKRIGYLMKKADDYCFTTRQAFLLCRQLQAESMRYSFLKKIYPHVTDQQNFPLLADALFKTLEWKSYFKLIYAP